MHASLHAAPSLVPYSDLIKMPNPPPASGGGRTTIFLRAFPFRYALRMSTQSTMSTDANEINHRSASRGDVGRNWDDSLSAAPLTSYATSLALMPGLSAYPLLARTQFVEATFDRAGTSSMFSRMRSAVPSCPLHQLRMPSPCSLIPSQTLHQSWSRSTSSTRSSVDHSSGSGIS